MLIRFSFFQKDELSILVLCRMIPKARSLLEENYYGFGNKALCKIYIMLY